MVFPGWICGDKVDGEELAPFVNIDLAQVRTSLVPHPQRIRPSRRQAILG